MDLMPTRVQIAKKFHSEEARDGVTMSGISEWKRHFYATRQLRCHCVFSVSGCGRYLTTIQNFLWDLKHRYVIWTSYCCSVQIAGRDIPILIGASIFKRAFFYSRTCQPLQYNLQRNESNLTHYAVYLAFNWKSVSWHSQSILSNCHTSYYALSEYLSLSESVI